MRYEGWLSFRRIICMRCGDARVVGIPCPTCGFLADEREVDPDRQRVSSQALEALNAAGPPGVPLRPEPEGIWDRLGDLLETFLASLLEEIARPGDGAKLTAAIMALRQIEADVEATPRLRPWVETWRSIAEVLARLHRVAKGSSPQPLLNRLLRLSKPPGRPSSSWIMPQTQPANCRTGSSD